MESSLASPCRPRTTCQEHVLPLPQEDAVDAIQKFTRNKPRFIYVCVPMFVYAHLETREHQIPWNGLVSHHVGARTKPRSTARTTITQPLSNLSSPVFI